MARNAAIAQPPLDHEAPGGSSNSFSFPSQPPDVKNWFSSYEYESPESSCLPYDLGSYLLSEGKEDETQDPLWSLGKQGFQDPSQDEVSQNLSDVFQRKPSWKWDDGGTVGTIEDVPRSRGDAVSDKGRSLDRLLDLDLKEENLDGKEDGKDKWVSSSEWIKHLEANKTFATETLHPRHNVGKDDIVLRKKEENRDCGGKVRDELIATRSQSDRTYSLQENGQCRELQCESSAKREFLPMMEEKRKLPELHEKICANYGVDGDGFIPLRFKKSIMEQHGSAACALKIKSGKAEGGEQVGEGWKLVSKTYSVQENDATIDPISTRNVKISRSADRRRPPMESVVRDEAAAVSCKYSIHCTSPSKENNVNMGKEAQAGKRCALADKTNVEAGLDAAMEIPGKWQCPRKSKPSTGPPLKQLRLERWVHRVI